jgi:hypothetical protein
MLNVRATASWRHVLVGIAFGFSAALSACSDPGSGAAPGWSCYSLDAGCGCVQPMPGWRLPSGSMSVERCADLPCCVFRQVPDEKSLSQCLCSPDRADCEPQSVASIGGDVVDSCPVQ